MSNVSCRDRYYNYGSYLRSRGADKAVCELDKKIHKNTVDIATNTANIAINTANIAINTANITDLSNIISNYDVSFTTVDIVATNLDVSGDVNFTKNPIVTNDVSYNNRVLQCYSESTSILDISVSTITPYVPALYDLSLNSIIYTDLDPSAQSVFTNNLAYIDFSNNQPYFNNSLLEVYVSAKLQFDSVQTNSISFVFDKVGASIQEIILDTRSINQIGTPTTVCFGPQMFAFKDGDFSTDISFIYDQWQVGIDICGGNPSGTVTFTENPRMTIKQKSIV